MYIYFLSFHYSTPLTKHTRRKTYIFSFFFFLLLFYPPSLQSSLMKVSFCPNNNNNIFYFLWGLNQNGLLSSPTSCVSLTWRYTFCSPHFFWVKQIQANGLHSCGWSSVTIYVFPFPPMLLQLSPKIWGTHLFISIWVRWTHNSQRQSVSNQLVHQHGLELIRLLVEFSTFCLII